MALQGDGTYDLTLTGTKLGADVGKLAVKVGGTDASILSGPTGTTTLKVKWPGHIAR
jgi:hypothetical protein